MTTKEMRRGRSRGRRWKRGKGKNEKKRIIQEGVEDFTTKKILVLILLRRSISNEINEGRMINMYDYSALTKADE